MGNAQRSHRSRQLSGFQRFGNNRIIPPFVGQPLLRFGGGKHERDFPLQKLRSQRKDERVSDIHIENGKIRRGGVQQRHSGREVVRYENVVMPHLAHNVLKIIGDKEFVFDDQYPHRRPPLAMPIDRRCLFADMVVRPTPSQARYPPRPA